MSRTPERKAEFEEKDQVQMSPCIQLCLKSPWLLVAQLNTLPLCWLKTVDLGFYDLQPNENKTKLTSAGCHHYLCTSQHLPHQAQSKRLHRIQRHQLRCASPRTVLRARLPSTIPTLLIQPLKEDGLTWLFIGAAKPRKGAALSKPMSSRGDIGFSLVTSSPHIAHLSE